MNAPAPPPATEAAGPLRLDATSAVELSGELAARVDAADSGVDRLLVTETARDPFQVLAAAAQRTTRVELGTGVAIAFARTPMTLAVSAWDLQRSSGGRAVIGLGSQVRAHIERRYGMPWSRPAARMREFVLATRAIWDAWQHRTKLEVRGEFYHHTLMMAPFDPGPLPHPAPPVLLAAVGPRMARVAGEVADGIICHPMATPEHLRDQVLPRVFEARRAAEAADAAWTRRPFEVCGGVLAAVGRTDEELEHAIAGVRERIAFYGSTPGYEAALDARGWHDLHTDLHALSRQSRWPEMAALIDDAVLDAFAVVGTPAQVARAVDGRYRGVLDRVSLALSRKADPAAAYDTIAEIRALG